MPVQSPLHPCLDRVAVEGHTVAFFRRGWPTLPDVRLVDVAGRRWVVKDWSRRAWWRRMLQGRFMLRREHRFLQALSNVEGVPRVDGFPDRDALAIEYVVGRPTADVGPSDYPPGFFDRLEALVRQVHSHGIAHGDLDQDDNILMRADGTPALIDFGNAMRRTWIPLAAAWFELLRLHDLQCLERQRVRLDTVHPAARPRVPAPRLRAWQRRILVFFHKMDRPSVVRHHGVGEAPGAATVYRRGRKGRADQQMGPEQ